MKPMHCMAQPLYTGLLLGFALVVCYTATVVAHGRLRQRRRFRPKMIPTPGRISFPYPRQARRRFSL